MVAMKQRYLNGDQSDQSNLQSSLSPRDHRSGEIDVDDEIEKKIEKKRGGAASQ